MPKQLLDPLTKWPHKVLSQQPEVCVKVEVGVCVALGGEVGSKEGPVVLMELLKSWVEGYGPEILLFFFNWIRNSGIFGYLHVHKTAWSFSKYLNIFSG